MIINETDQATPIADMPPVATPLLRTLGDVDAAVCSDGFCEVPQRREAPGPATTGADE